MKKIVSVILIVVMMTAAFAYAFTVSTYKAQGYSVDWYLIDGQLITSRGDVNQYVNYNKQTYVKNADDTENDTVAFFGWAALAGGAEIKSFGYKIDGKAPVYDNNFFSRLTTLEGFKVDRTQELAGAGIVNGEGFIIRFNYSQLSDGEHSVSFLVKGDDDEDTVIFSYDFAVLPAGSAEPARLIGTVIDNVYREGDTIIIEGWTGANYEMDKLGYSIDNGEPVFDDSITLIDVAADDPVRAPENGGQYAKRYRAVIDLEKTGIPEGDHLLALMLKVKDGKGTVLRAHITGDGKTSGAIKFTYGDFSDHDNDVWLCKEADSFGACWWMHPAGLPNQVDWDIIVEFSTKEVFNGFYMACFSGAEPAELHIELQDEDEEILEEKEISVTGDHNTKAGMVKVKFDKAYDKGTYILNIVLLSRGESYLVLGGGEIRDDEIGAVVFGDNSESVEGRAPAIKLIGAQLSEEPGDDSGEAPGDDSGEIPGDESGKVPGEEPGGDTGKDDPIDEPVEPVKPKDVNGDGNTDNKDVVILFRYVSVGGEYAGKYDINGDGEVNNKDVVALFRAVSKM